MGIANRKFEATECHKFIREYWSEWFPALPAYQNFKRRIIDLHDIFRIISSCLITERGIDPKLLDYMIDSMPIMVSNEKCSGSAVTVGEICDKGYCSSKNCYYYGGKLHALVQKQPSALPCLFAS